MTQPTPYDLAFSFQGYQIANPSRPLPADKLEVEFNALTLTTDQIIANLGLIQRSDGGVVNLSIGYDQLKVELQLGLPQPTVWATATAYAIRAAVFQTTGLYRAVVAHTSGTFSTDLAAGKWELLIDLAAGGPVITFNGRAGVVTPLAADYDSFFLTPAEGNAAYQPLDSDLTSIAALTTTAYGRAFLALADASAARTAIGAVIGTDVQAFDADLAALAGLTSAADKGIQFTGVGTAATYDLTAAGKALLDDANAAAQRATLAAAGLADANVFTADQTITSADAGAGQGPVLVLMRDSASPLAGDIMGLLDFQGRDSGAALQQYAGIYGEIVDPTAASEDGRFRIRTLRAGGTSDLFITSGAMAMPAATGGVQAGEGTINATKYYVNGIDRSTTTVSADQTVPVAAGLLTYAHGLGAKPFHILVELKNTTAELGYSVGDMVRIDSLVSAGGTTLVEVYADATNVNVAVSSTADLNVLHKTTRVSTAITAASWRVVISMRM